MTEPEALDHRSVLKTLSAEQRKNFNAKTNGAGLIGLAIHFGGIAICGTAIAFKIPFWPLIMLVQGILIVFLFTLMHEVIHRTVFVSRWLNDAVAVICGVLLFLPPSWFRFFHFAHHRHTQDPEKDPELVSPKPDTLWDYCAHVSGLPVWKSQLVTIFNNAAGRFSYDYLPNAGRGEVIREARWMIALYAVLLAISLYFSSTFLLIFWLAPALFGQPFLRLYLLAEHGRCAFVSNMLENTRTTYTNWLVRRLAWNMPFHIEHHSLPAVPFHRLPELHKIMQHHLRETENGYVLFNRKYVVHISGP